MGLKELRERNKNAVASWIVVSSLLASLIYLGILGWEIRSAGNSSGEFARCVLLSVSDLSIPSKVIEYSMLVLTFGASVIAKDFNRIKSWWAIVIGSLIVGLLSFMLIVYLNTGENALYVFRETTCYDIMVHEGADGVPEKVDENIERVNGKALSALWELAGWCATLLAVQLGLKVFKFE